MPRNASNSTAIAPLTTRRAAKVQAMKDSVGADSDYDKDGFVVDDDESIQYEVTDEEREADAASDEPEPAPEPPVTPQKRVTTVPKTPSTGRSNKRVAAWSDDEESPEEITVPKSSPKKVKTPKKKAKVEASPSPPNRKSTASSRGRPKPKPKASPKKEVKSAVLVDDSDVEIIDNSPSRNKGKQKKANVAPTSNDDEDDFFSKIEAGSQDGEGGEEGETIDSDALEAEIKETNKLLKSFASTKTSPVAVPSDNVSYVGDRVTSWAPIEQDESLQGIELHPLLRKGLLELPGLKSVGFVPAWSRTEGVQVDYESVRANHFPDRASHRALRTEVTFTRSGHLINLSRINPIDVSTSSMPRSYIVPRGDQAGAKPLIALSVGIVNGCWLYKPRDPIGAQQTKSRQIDVKLIEGEFERLICCLGHIYRQEQLEIPIHDGALAFSTAGFYSNKGGGGGSSSKFDAKSKSPLTKRVFSSTSAYVKALDDDVPIYDARNKKLEEGVSCLAEMRDRLPKFAGDVPESACVEVGYSVFLRENKNSRHEDSNGMLIQLNVQFVIVLATNFR